MQQQELIEGVRAGNRRALARAITLVESARPDHRVRAQQLLQALGGARQALRIGLSGTPGVGKSTFIETFGLRLIKAGLKVAVLAVDPSSARSGGSILGDKTRMDRLARAPGAYIRPSPSQTHLGGVTRRTREAVALCEAAGYDVVVIETVGVGQSETLVSGMSDLFILLMAPAGGDELQGVKRGIMEKADMILVNKADGDLRAQAMRTCADYAGALRLLRKRPEDPEGFPKARCVSAETGDGLDEAWSDMRFIANWRRETGIWDRVRADQRAGWFNSELREAAMAAIPVVAAPLEQAVRMGEISVQAAIDQALAHTGLRELLLYRLVPGGGAGFAGFVAQEVLPAQARAGCRVLTASPAHHCPDLYVIERRFADAAALQQAGPVIALPHPMVRELDRVVLAGLPRLGG